MLLGVVLDLVESFLNEDVKDVHWVEGRALEDKASVLTVQLTGRVDAFEPQVDRLHVARVQAYVCGRKGEMTLVCD